MAEREKKYRPSTVFKVGAVSFTFLIIGYQAALFMHRAASLRIEANRDSPDTVYVVDSAVAAAVLSGGGDATYRASQAPHEGTARSGASIAVQRSSSPKGTRAGTNPTVTVRRDAEHSEAVKAVRRETRKVENFHFNPNTVSVEDLQRLGFSGKQALAIDRYRQSGGRFRRKADFAKSFVVADSVYERLKPFIDIPLVDINAADSAAFDALPGIGGWTAAKMVSYRSELGGYSCTEQLMDIYRFDRVKYDGLKDLVTCRNPMRSFGLWTLPAEELRKHPYIRSWQTARSIVFYRNNNPRSEWTTKGLSDAGIIADSIAVKLSWCSAAPEP